MTDIIERIGAAIWAALPNANRQYGIGQNIDSIALAALSALRPGDELPGGLVVTENHGLLTDGPYMVRASEAVQASRVIDAASNALLDRGDHTEIGEILVQFALGKVSYPEALAELEPPSPKGGA